MGWSGLIYAAIVAGWAAVLVPRWVRRNEEAERAKAADALAGVRVLERRGRSAAGAAATAPDAASRPGFSTTRRHVLHAPHPPVPDLPPRMAAAARDETGAVRLPGLRPAPPPEPPPAPLPAKVAAASRASRRAAATRRRRVLALLLGLLLGCLAATAAGVVPAGLLLVPGLLLAGFVVLARAAVRGEAAEARTSRRPRGRTRARDARHAGVARVQDHVLVAASAADPALPEVAGAVPADGPESLPADDGSWEPVPVPLPTYVTAPKAPRLIRRIDLTTPGAWTAAAPTGATHGAPGPEQTPAATTFPGLPPLVAADPLDGTGDDTGHATDDDDGHETGDDGYEHRRAVGD